MRKNTKLFIGGTVIFIAILSLLITATPSMGVTEVSLQEIIQNLNKYVGDYLITEGLLVEKSIRWNADDLELRFQIVDEEGKRLDVYYQGVRPDNFSDGVIVTVEGTVDRDGLFKAEKLLTKCPSKYEGQDQENYDIELHKQLLNKDESNK